VEMTGTTNPDRRAELWEMPDKRLYFMTPGTLKNDLAKGERLARLHLRQPTTCKICARRPVVCLTLDNRIGTAVAGMSWLAAITCCTSAMLSASSQESCASPTMRG